MRLIDYGNTYYTPLTEILDCPEPYRGPGLAVPFTGQIDEKPVSFLAKYEMIFMYKFGFPTVFELEHLSCKKLTKGSTGIK